MKNIDEFAFRSCKQLEEVIFYSSGDTIIGEGAFSETSSLKEIKIPEGVIFMYEGCFAESGIEKIELPVSLQKVGAYAFSQCKNLKQITYAGTRADWMGVEVSSIAWNLSSATEIVCSDGVYEIKR